MKKYRITVLLMALMPLLAGAQSTAIEELAEKYSDREGFTTTVVKGIILNDMRKGVGIKQIDIANVMSDIKSLVVIVADQPDRQFTLDVNSAIASQNYTTIMSVSNDGQHIKFLLSSPDAAERKAKETDNEFIIFLSGPEDNMVMSIVGKYKLKGIHRTEKEDSEEAEKGEDDSE